MEFYTSVVQHRNEILVRGYLDGKRFKDSVKYKPTLFVPCGVGKTSQYKTLQGKYVDKVTFDSIKEAREFMRQYSGVVNMNIYGMDKYVYTYIHETYPGEIKYDASLINKWNIDIEVASDDGFPSIQDADKEVISITVGLKKKRIVFGCGDYTATRPEVTYIRCKDEQDLLQKFMKLWTDEDHMPDVVTGWYIEFFDIPYLVNRLRKLFGEGMAKALSPWGILSERTVEIKGRESTVYTPVGVAILDYMDLYKKFTYTQQESYTLDHIAWVETGQRKLDYSEYESLNELYKQDYQKFIDYNIVDVDRVDDIDDKMRLIDLVYAIAYDAKANFEDALTSVRLWDVIIYNYLMEQNIVVPPQPEDVDFKLIDGAYVKDPKPGMYDWVCSFDLTSLYPHLIMQYNISPETFAGMYSWYGPKPTVRQIVEGAFTDSDLQEHLHKNDVTITPNLATYTRKSKGFLPKLMELQFAKRAEYKNKMLDAKRANEQNPSDELEREIARYNNAQMAKKIQLNSAYGALANKYFRYYNSIHAEAITSSGQLSAMWIENEMNKHINKVLGTTDKDYIIAVDTDSIYIDLGDFVKRGESVTNDTFKLVDNVCKKMFEPYMAKRYEKLAVYVNAFEQKMKMKREAIANKGIWTSKKHYILNVLNNEGVHYAEPQLKIMGIEAVRSSTPASCRDSIKDALKIIMNKDENAVIDYIAQFKKKFFQLPFEEIAFPRSVQGLSKYYDRATLFKVGTPIQVKGALVYNHFLKQKGLDKKYPEIFEKDKIKFVYLTLPNPTFSRVIACSSYLPKEFGLDKYIDYETQFEKAFLIPIKNILDVIGWQTEKKATLEGFFDEE